MGVKIIPRHGKSIKEKAFLPGIFSGLGTTLRHFGNNLKKPETIKTMQYPEEMPEDITDRYRGVHRLTKREDDSVRCVACFMCSTACPADCIFIEATEREDNIDEKMPATFNIDLLECIYCGLCVEACPCDAIRMDTGIFNFVAKNREDFVLNKDQLLSHKGAFGD